MPIACLTAHQLQRCEHELESTARHVHPAAVMGVTEPTSANLGGAMPGGDGCLMIVAVCAYRRTWKSDGVAYCIAHGSCTRPDLPYIWMTAPCGSLLLGGDHNAGIIRPRLRAAGSRSRRRSTAASCGSAAPRTTPSTPASSCRTTLTSSRGPAAQPSLRLHLIRELRAGMQPRLQRQVLSLISPPCGS